MPWRGTRTLVARRRQLTDLNLLIDSSVSTYGERPNKLRVTMGRNTPYIHFVPYGLPLKFPHIYFIPPRDHSQARGWPPARSAACTRGRDADGTPSHGLAAGATRRAVGDTGDWAGADVRHD